MPFELSRVTLSAAGDLLTFDVWAPRHAFRTAERSGLEGAGTVAAFALDPTGAKACFDFCRTASGTLRRILADTGRPPIARRGRPGCRRSCRRSGKPPP